MEYVLGWLLSRFDNQVVRAAMPLLLPLMMAVAKEYISWILRNATSRAARAGRLRERRSMSLRNWSKRLTFGYMRAVEQKKQKSQVG